MSACPTLARRGRFGGLPVPAPHSSEEVLLFVVFLEHVESFGDQLDGGVTFL